MIGGIKLKIFLLFGLSFWFINLIKAQEICSLDNSLNYGYLESPIFDMGDSYKITKISWQGGKTEKHFVGFQLASSISSSGPWYFYGKNFSSNYIDITPFTIYSFSTNNPHQNIRYFKYKIFLGSCEEFSTPVINKIIIYYSK